MRMLSSRFGWPGGLPAIAHSYRVVAEARRAHAAVLLAEGKNGFFHTRGAPRSLTEMGQPPHILTAPAWRNLPTVG
jgi:hypothetical protein